MEGARSPDVTTTGRWRNRASSVSNGKKRRSITRGLKLPDHHAGRFSKRVVDVDGAASMLNAPTPPVRSPSDTKAWDRRPPRRPTEVASRAVSISTAPSRGRDPSGRIPGRMQRAVLSVARSGATRRRSCPETLKN